MTAEPSTIKTVKRKKYLNGWKWMEMDGNLQMYFKLKKSKGFCYR